MKYLLMCEGQNEEAIIEILLQANSLKITRDDLIGRRAYPIRQLNHPTIKTELKHYGAPVIIYRIGDKQTDKLVIPKELKNIVLKENIFRYCTKPELEILLIINESLINEYEKVKSTQSPKIFAKRNIKFNGKKYDQSSDYLKLYYGGTRTSKLINNIKEYKRYKKHTPKELYLADLLKDSL